MSIDTCMEDRPGYACYEHGGEYCSVAPDYVTGLAMTD